jgi:hypothetical protein
VKTRGESKSRAGTPGWPERLDLNGREAIAIRRGGTAREESTMLAFLGFGGACVLGSCVMACRFAEGDDSLAMNLGGNQVMLWNLTAQSGGWVSHLRL